MKATKEDLHESGRPLSQEEFINKIKTDDEFAKKWGSLGKIYGAQWRDWEVIETKYDEFGENHYEVKTKHIDQITNLINDLKTNPDSRRLMVSAWNVGELGQMVLPPCHYGFQVYTRELSLDERIDLLNEKGRENGIGLIWSKDVESARLNGTLEQSKIPTRAISLMWNQRSVNEKSAA